MCLEKSLDQMLEILDYTMKSFNLNQVPQAQKEDQLFQRRQSQLELDWLQILRFLTTTKELFTLVV